MIIEETVILSEPFDEALTKVKTALAVAENAVAASAIHEHTLTLDQAAVLIEKLKVYAEELDKRQVVAQRYTAALKDSVVTPHVMADCVSTWAQYTIRVAADRRDGDDCAQCQGPPVLHACPGMHLAGVIGVDTVRFFNAGR